MLHNLAASEPDETMAADDLLERETRQLVSTFCSRFSGEVANLVDIVEQSQQTFDYDQPPIKRLYEELHRVKGSAACFGFPTAADKIEQIYGFVELIHKGGTQPTGEQMMRIAQSLRALAHLRSEITPDNSMLLHKQPVEVGATIAFRKQKAVIRPEDVLKKQSVIFADDDVGIRMLMRGLLRNVGIGHVDVAATGVELLEKAEMTRISMVITDWRMNPVSGMDILHKIRSGKTRLARDCPIIFLSGAGTVKDVQTAINAGVDDFIVKPFSRKLVERAIFRVLGKRGLL